eukprot:6478798-Amphidinium_carterae.1
MVFVSVPKEWAPEAFPKAIHPDTPRRWAQLKQSGSAAETRGKKVSPVMVQKFATMTLSLIDQGTAVSVDLCVALFNRTLQNESMTARVGREWVRLFLLDMGLSNKRRASSGLHQHTEAQKLHVQRRVKLKIAWTQQKYDIPWGKVWNVDETSCYLLPSPNTGWYYRGKDQKPDFCQNKSQVTVTLCARPTGGTVLSQIIFKGSTPRCLPVGPQLRHCVCTFSETHWATESTLMQLIFQ